MLKSSDKNFLTNYVCILQITIIHRPPDEVQACGLISPIILQINRFSQSTDTFVVHCLSFFHDILFALISNNKSLNEILLIGINSVSLNTKLQKACKKMLTMECAAPHKCFEISCKYGSASINLTFTLHSAHIPVYLRAYILHRVSYTQCMHIQIS